MALSLPNHLPTRDAQYAAAETIEALTNNPALDLLVDDNVQHQFVEFEQDQDHTIRFDTRRLPAVISESLQYFIGVTDVDEFSADIARWPRQNDSKEDWAFNLRLRANGTDVEMHSSNNYGSELLTTNIDGSRLTYKCRPEDITTVIGGITLAAVRSYGGELPEDFSAPTDNFGRLKLALETLGNVCGTCVSTTRALVPEVIEDRQLVVERVNIETPKNSAQAVHLYMGWRMGDDTYETAATVGVATAKFGETEDMGHLTSARRYLSLGGLDDFGVSAGDVLEGFVKVRKIDPQTEVPEWLAAATSIAAVLEPPLSTSQGKYADFARPAIDD